MEFYDVINARRTIRDFQEDTIDMEVINRIIDSGMKAPTNDHMRDWHFIIVKDKAIPKQYQMLFDASCVLIPLFKQKRDLLKPKDLSALNAFASIWCCIENIFLAITAEKYAYALRVPLGDEQEYVRSILKFPEEYVMPCYIAIGKPKDDAVYNEQNKYEIENRIHLNEW